MGIENVRNDNGGGNGLPAAEANPALAAKTATGKVKDVSMTSLTVTDKAGKAKVLATMSGTRGLASW